jgi:hypothetical protein
VTSIWYRILVRVFVLRLNVFVPKLFSSQQHGFCPNRSTVTAIGSTLPTIENCKVLQKPVFMAAVDVNKAYDSVNR